MEQNVAQLSVSDRAWAWFESNKKQVIWGAGALAVVAFVVSFYSWRKGEQEVNAAEAFTRAAETTGPDGRRVESPDAFLKLAAEHAGTRAAERAVLEAGGLLFAQSKFPEAQTQFERFVRENPGSAYLPQAMLGIAACLDAAGKADDAARAYESLASRFPTANVAPQAQFALARIYETQGKLDQALALFEKLAQADLNSSVGSEAGIRAEELRAKMPVTPVPQPSVAVTPGVTAPVNPDTAAAQPAVLKTN